MIRIIDKDSIMRYILPHLSIAQRGYSSRVERWEIVNAILYKFKTGVPWHLLPVNSLISSGHIQYGAVFHHFRKWTKDGGWQQVWINLLNRFKKLLDLSTAQFDGTHTLCQRGGQQVAYQGRKKARTTNTLWLTDRQGRVVAFCPPLAGNHHNVYDIDQQLASMVNTLQQANIQVEGLFINADAGHRGAILTVLPFGELAISWAFISMFQVEQTTISRWSHLVALMN